MKDKTPLYIILGLIVVAAFAVMLGCNKARAQRNACDAQWANVEVVMQRRGDLIPNLIETVKGESAFEKDVLERVIQARASATQVKVTASDLDKPEKVKALADAQAQLSHSIGRLLAVSERYPDLKSNHGFRELRAQLEGAENRIAEERRRYNRAVEELNNTLDTFPSSIGAGFAGVPRREPLRAPEASLAVPKVSF